METVIIIGVVLFVLLVVIYSAGYMFEMILYPEEIAKEYWDEYWEKEGQYDEGKSVSEAD